MEKLDILVKDFNNMKLRERNLKIKYVMIFSRKYGNTMELKI